jgi:hypothetical protein
LWAYAGAGVILGPLIGGQLLKWYGHPKYTYFAVSAIGAIHWLHNYFLIGETLDEDKRRPCEGFVSPFGFTKLFTENATLTKLALAAATISFMEGKNINDMNQLWLKFNVNMSQGSVQNWVVLYGIFMFTGGQYVVPWLINQLGSRGFTTFTNVTNAAGLILWGAVPKPWASWVGLFLLWFGINANSSSTLKAQATAHAVSAGMGRGEYAGYFSNLRALIVATAPLLYGNVYAAVNSPTGSAYPNGLAYFMAAGLGAILPEILHRSVSDEDITLPKKDA